uniref:Uncharacterized protein n=1 Tax=Candidozyma auris TaxID=498019 RepID=A0A0L0NZ61_CANAR
MRNSTVHINVWTEARWDVIKRDSNSRSTALVDVDRTGFCRLWEVEVVDLLGDGSNDRQTVKLNTIVRVLDFNVTRHTVAVTRWTQDKVLVGVTHNGLSQPVDPVFDASTKQVRVTFVEVDLRVKFLTSISPLDHIRTGMPHSRGF